jgi:hypothetical protein
MSIEYKNIDEWSRKDYHKFYQQNELATLHRLFLKQTEGFRLFVWTPSYLNQKEMGVLNVKCDTCDGNAILNNDLKKAALYVCEKCGKEIFKIFRWTKASKDSGNIVIKDNNQLLYYSLNTRVMYFTLGIWKNREIRQGKDGEYGKLEKLKAWNLAIDIDVKNSLFLKPKNINKMGIVLDLIRQDLNEIVPNSYELMSSGNGMYVLLNHKLTAGFSAEMFMKTKLVWSSYQECINELLNESEIKNIKLDASSTFLSSAFIKLPYTFHKRYNIISVPLKYDIDFTKSESRQLLMNTNFDDKIKFNIKDYPKFYTRYDENDKQSLINWVNKYYDEHITEEKQSDNTIIVKDTWGNILTQTRFEKASKKSKHFNKDVPTYVASSLESQTDDDWPQCIEKFMIKVND